MIEATKKDMKRSSALYAKSSNWELQEAREKQLERGRKELQSRGSEAAPVAVKRELPLAPTRWRPGSAIRKSLVLTAIGRSGVSEEARANAKVTQLILQGLKRMRAPA